MLADLKYPARVTYGNDGVGKVLWLQAQMIDTPIWIDDKVCFGNIGHAGWLNSNQLFFSSDRKLRMRLSQKG